MSTALFPGLTDAQAKLLVETANAIGANPQHLWEVINMESRHNPLAYNPSGAVGLIQFMPDTLKDMGLLSAATDPLVKYGAAEPEHVKQAVRAEFTARFPTWEAQMRGPVRQYFGRGPYPSRQSLYMKVFYPVAMHVPPDTTFESLYKKYGGASWESKYKAFVRQNPGILTVNDYVVKAAKRSGVTLPLVAAAAGGAGLLIFAAALFLFRSGRGVV